MSSLRELAERLRIANPQNNPMSLGFMAEQFWPNADWLKKTCRNGGARRGALVAAGIAGRMSKMGLVKRHLDSQSSTSRWVLSRNR